jgi:hypothetical protein
MIQGIEDFNHILALSKLESDYLSLVLNWKSIDRIQGFIEIQ